MSDDRGDRSRDVPQTVRIKSVGRREGFYFEKSAISRRGRMRQSQEGDIKARYRKLQGEASTVG